MKTLIDVVNYWFEKQKDYKKWFLSGSYLDAYISDNYKELLDYHLHNDDKYEITKLNLKIILGKIILLDQFSRHVYRDTAKAFDGEKFALPLSIKLLETGLLEYLSIPERIFALMPLQHSENIKDKELILKYLDHIENIESISMLSSFKQHTLKHYNILRTYGRYPKRNKALSRESNQNELEYIQKNLNRHF